MAYDVKATSSILLSGRDRAPARSFLKAIGYSDEDLEKPIIGIANTWTETMPCNFNLRQLAVRIKEGVRAAGGDAGPPAIVVDGSGAKPSVGWTANGTPVATIFVTAVPEWAARAPHARARVGKAGELELDGAAPTATTLLVIVAGW